MSQVGVRALKQNASAVVADAAAGREITITDRGRPVAAGLDLGDDLDGVVTHDDRHASASAAAALGIVVIAPT